MPWLKIVRRSREQNLEKNLGSCPSYLQLNNLHCYNKNPQHDRIAFSSQSDLDLDPMAFIYKFDLNMDYHHTKKKVSRSRHSKVTNCRDRHTQTDTQYKNFTFPAYAGSNKRGTLQPSPICCYTVIYLRSSLS